MLNQTQCLKQRFRRVKNSLNIIFFYGKIPVIKSAHGRPDDNC